MQRMFLVLLLTGCATSASVAENLKAIPENLSPAAGESLKRVIRAKGVQIYECRDQKWVFVAPDADLFDEKGNRIGRHYAGPHWEATGDGSKVLGTVKTRADAPEAGAIPWLLLTTRSVGGRGYFSDVTSIQRVATHGGTAPGIACVRHAYGSAAEAGGELSVESLDRLLLGVGECDGASAHPGKPIGHHLIRLQRERAAALV